MSLCIYQFKFIKYFTTTFLHTHSFYGYTGNISLLLKNHDTIILFIRKTQFVKGEPMSVSFYNAINHSQQCSVRIF